MTAPAIKQGDILTSSWGYSMTIVDFYKVVKVTPHTLVLQQIGVKDSVQTGFLSGTVMPNPDDEVTYTCWRTGPVISASGARAPIEKPVRITRRRAENGYGICRDRNGHGSCHLWDGKPRHYNHCD